MMISLLLVSLSIISTLVCRSSSYPQFANRPFPSFRREHSKAFQNIKLDFQQAFRPVQLAREQGSRNNFQQPSDSTVKKIDLEADLDSPINSGFSPFSPFFSGNLIEHSGNIIEQTRAQTESIKTVLKSLENNKQAAQYIQRVIDSSACIENFDDAVETIEEAASLVEKNGPEIQNLINLLDLLESEKDVTRLVRSSAHIIRILEDLIPNLTSRSSKVCNASPSKRIEAVKGISKLLEDILDDHDIHLLDVNRDQLKLSSKITSEVASFLGRLNKSLSSFGTICSGARTSNTAVYDTLGEIMESLANMFETLGGVKKANEIRKKGDLVKQIVDTFDSLDIKPSQECSFTALAQTLEDLADIVESVGIERLSQELGINLNFINKF